MGNSKIKVEKQGKKVVFKPSDELVKKQRIVELEKERGKSQETQKQILERIEAKQDVILEHLGIKL
jgi:hypothetical protein